MKKTLPQYTVNQLNKLVEKGNIVSVKYNDSIYTLTCFGWLEIGDDYYDQDEKDAGACGLNAYVEEVPYRLPIEDITDIYIAQKIEVR